MGILLMKTPSYIDDRQDDEDEAEQEVDDLEDESALAAGTL